MIDIFKEPKYLRYTYMIAFMQIYHGLCLFLNGDKNIDFYGDVTVLIPCYKKSGYIEEAVKSCAEQSVKVNVITLLMDEESQKLKPRLESYKNVKCIIHDRMNVCDARTFLVDNCSTDWFIFLDGDDSLPFDFVEKITKCDGAIRFPNSEISYNNKTSIFPHIRKNNITNIIPGNNTCLMHKSVFYDYGYDPSLCFGGEDTDFMLRMLGDRKWKITFCADTYYKYSFDSENQLTKDFSKFSESLEKSVVKNKDIIIKSLNNHNIKYNVVKQLIYTLENYTHELLLSFIDYNCNYVLLNTRFNVLLNEYFEKIYKNNKHNKQPLVLGYGRILSLEDVFFYIKELNLKSPKDLFEKMSQSKIEVTGTNNRKRTVLNDKDFLNKVKNLVFPDEIQRYINIWRLREELNNIKDNTVFQKVSFTFNRTCNKRCSYCFQDKKEKVLSDDELYNNFDKGLSRLEKLTNNRIYPQILGGEPTLFSDYLISKIKNRLKDYPQFLIFTNNTNLNSSWYECENMVSNNHIVDWVGHKSSDYKIIPGTIYSIIVTHEDIKYLSDFLKDGTTKIIINPCISDNEKLNTTYEDKLEIAKIAKEHNCMCGLLNDILNIDIYELREMCKTSSGVWEYDCINNTIGICCSAKERVPIDKFTGKELKHCDGCFNFGNMY